MIVALLLLIVAILLFGSSAIIGAVGYVLGFIAFVACLGVAAYYSSPIFEYFGFQPNDAPALIIIVLGVVIAAGRLVIYVIDRRQ